MSKKLRNCVLLSMVVVVAFSVAGLAQAGGRGAASPPRPDNAQSLAHIEAAKKTAGNDVAAPFNFFCIPANTRANNANAPELEPVKVFDNLYAAGNSETIVYRSPPRTGSY